MGQALFDEVVWEADRRGLLSDEHFSVDGTLIEAVASITRASDGEMRRSHRPAMTPATRGWTFVERG